ncbi:hypothetical protein BDP27DRAFT_1302891 [Rhodocollybia butyracea]|uniref:DUF6534 domain-containing protein n=1 Tax=Rhodocollybia butyracea TaxID=206335 RepID=A0A9P5P5A2_9AGAR|nr:hypothetical protein BDP27DRAFT_1302891 [Rhodocollybia butyracea]
MVSPLAPTYGAWLVSVWFATILYGVGLLQTWLYFHWYSSDHWGVRLTVVALILLETLHISFLFASTYNSFVNNFGNASTIFMVTWLDSAQLLAGYLSAFIVQSYFAWCLFLLNKKQKKVTLLIMALALAQIGAGLAQTINITVLGTLLKIEATKPALIFQSAATLSCDAVITIALYLTLRSKRTGMDSTNTLLQKLTVIAVNRGAFTTLGAAVNMTLFLALPGTFYYLLGLMTSSKLYLNSMLATLNTRQHIKQTAHDSERAWNSIHLAGLSTVPNGTGTTMLTAYNSEDTKSNRILNGSLVENMI